MLIPIHNIFHVITTAFYLIFSMHITSCMWINIGFRLNGWINTTDWGYDGGVFDITTMGHENAFKIYWNAMYYISATMTTIGYGDISGYVGDGPHSKPEMYFVMLLEFFGILTLTYISEAIMKVE